MSFELKDAAQLRALDADAFEQYRSALVDALNDATCEISTDDLMTNCDVVKEELRRRNAATELRNAKVAAVAGGAGKVIETTNVSTKHDIRSNDPDDYFDTPEYTEAFFNYVTRGIKTPGIVQPGMKPSYVRADAFSTVASDVPNFVPTTLMNEIIEKEELYGSIWPMLTKISVQGGVEYNTADFDAEAKWVTETTPSDDQKLVDGDRISFSYYMLEVRLAQSLLASVTTLSAFQRKFPEVAAKAMVKALEKGYINGTGSGQMTGLLTDARIPAENKIALSADDISTWAGWHKNVKSKMKPPYNTGVFLMNYATFDTYIDGMVDTNGQPVARVNYGVNGEEEYRFMGKRIMIVPDDILGDFDSLTGNDTYNADNVFAIFTQPSDYYVNTNMGMRSVRWVDEDANVVKNKMQTIVDGKILRPWGTYLLYKGTVGA